LEAGFSRRSACNKIGPPMIAMPSGLRSSKLGPTAMKVRFAPIPVTHELISVFVKSYQ
jgi:hypothetical protein